MVHGAHDDAWSRRRFLLSGSVALGATLAGCGASGTAAPSPPRTPTVGDSGIAAPTLEPPPRATRVGYCNVLSDGRWTGPRDEHGQPDTSLVDDILSTHSGYAKPAYLRMTSASRSGIQVPAEGSVELAALHRLTAGGVALGVAINACPPTGGRSASSIAEQAGQIRAASERAGNVYSWLFLDNAVGRTPAGEHGLDDLQQVMDSLIDAGWRTVAINASGFVPRTFEQLPGGAWGMARHFAALDGDYRTTVARALQAGAGAVTDNDLAFVDYVTAHHSASTPLLKLEISSQTDRFQQLGRSDQLALLEQWAKSGPQHGFRQIYPLFVPGQQPLGSEHNQYDSRTAGTFWTQRALMQRYG